ncbi:nuclear transport factor 2 family protein [Phenylobacterium sp.]|uniref:nuclear transport factor 2 family protein n=1 Tax=Phenylobacterium sp. TaxID=1871053 RepID=UPI002CE1FABD|nr:nuclear transport factor 2 family protein [Phenylobacterium sp.]HVI33414.1 nuclear transport factor 2 family protein [Phenylobacterium sp.]
MKTRLALAALAIVLAGPTAAQPPADAEQAAILAQIDRFFAAMKRQDTAGLEKLIYADGVMTIVRVAPDGSQRHVRRPVTAWLEGIRTSPDLDERIWSPTVMRRGPIAVVWAPYDIKQGGKRLHCGVDVFDMVQVEGQWKVASLMFTAEPGSCAELKAPE